MGGLLWVVLGDNDSIRKYGDTWNHTMYGVYTGYTLIELSLNILFFPLYLVALPFITLWNAVPDAFLIWAVIKDF